MIDVNDAEPGKLWRDEAKICGPSLEVYCVNGTHAGK